MMVDSESMCLRPLASTALVNEYLDMSLLNLLATSTTRLLGLVPILVLCIAETSPNRGKISTDSTVFWFLAFES